MRYAVKIPSTLCSSLEARCIIRRRIPPFLSTQFLDGHDVPCALSKSQRRHPTETCRIQCECGLDCHLRCRQVKGFNDMIFRALVASHTAFVASRYTSRMDCNSWTSSSVHASTVGTGTFMFSCWCGSVGSSTSACFHDLSSVTAVPSLLDLS
ncbi:hypothetical protein H310_08766 [Aphanomyces invadans]|uniref:Uncharacterized protein n=1 Tax=Aphanomyces invadans TaxID=157072 RepID=A0A024TXE0_9STRA|nr:hypothetical protein H310_08766 [Aphanomyces invadans]ETV98654.1 hypothetical protein H310_08766 [Aphanomyces invadans]|eukprot:XP_008872851.1 hypothetical protein H310_08766 [Aphanomyces invadans]